MIEDDRYGWLRQHQADVIDVANDVFSNRNRKTVVMSVTPGGGKSMAASIYAHEMLDKGLVDAVCVICPQDVLRHQMRMAFHSKERGRPRQIAAEGNASLGSTQTALFAGCGYVTTYQAVCAGLRKHLKRFKGKRFLLVLDEPHHLAEAEHAAWYQAVRQLFDLASYVLLMSGTLRRHDEQRIPFVDYDENNVAKVDITYSRRQALAEHAVIPIAFRLTDGEATYDYRHRSYAVSLKDAPKKQASRALKTVLLDDEYRTKFILGSLAEWAAYRREVYPSRAIVILHSVKAAKHAAAEIRKAIGADFSVALATSDDKKGRRALARFRDNAECHVLVTVNMAYEGLDVPDVTHLVCLTDKRSFPWLEQAITRATRFDPSCGRPWEAQQAFVYVPNDPEMQKFVDSLMEEQEASFREQAIAGVAPVRGRSTFIPMGAEMGDHEYGDLDGRLTAEENAVVAEAREQFPEVLRHTPPRRILEMCAKLSGKSAPKNGLVKLAPPPPREPRA